MRDRERRCFVVAQRPEKVRVVRSSAADAVPRDLMIAAAARRSDEFVLAWDRAPLPRDGHLASRGSGKSQLPVARRCGPMALRSFCVLDLNLLVAR